MKNLLKEKSVAYLVGKYDSVFTEIGRLPFEHRIPIHKSAVALVYAHRLESL
jgi:hypothetical protein